MSECECLYVSWSQLLSMSQIVQQCSDDDDYDEPNSKIQEQLIIILSQQQLYVTLTMYYSITAQKHK